MRGAAQQQLIFLRYGRPGAAATSLAVFGAVEAVAPSRAVERVLALLLVALVTSAIALLALRRFSLGAVARATIVVDIVLIAAMMVALDEPAVLTIAYYAPIAFSALMLGPAETLACSALACVATVVTAAIIREVRGVAEVADVLVLAVTGAVLAGLSREVRVAQDRLALERDVDAEALDVLEQVRATLDPNEVLHRAVETLGRLTDAARVIVRDVEEDVVAARWQRPGFERPPIGPTVVPTPSVRVAQTGQPLVVRSRRDADREMREFMDARGIASLIAYPAVFAGKVRAVLVVHDDRERPWTGAAQALVERVAPQFGAALAQARAYERLREVNRMREELIANVSHELRTPLTSTIGFLQTLERTDVDIAPAKRAEYLSLARREAERLALLVNDLLQLASLERGTLRIEPQPADLGQLARQAAEAVETDGREVVVDADGVFAAVDPERILQVLRNLVENALRHGDGKVVISAEQRPAAVRIIISDEGAGVAPEHVADLFVPFAHWSGRSDSTGLGLAIARRIAEAHGGSLTYRPAEDARPHAFVLELPAEARLTPVAVGNREENDDEEGTA